MTDEKTLAFERLAMLKLKYSASIVQAECARIMRVFEARDCPITIDELAIALEMKQTPLLGDFVNGLVLSGYLDRAESENGFVYSLHKITTSVRLLPQPYYLVP